MFRSVCRSAQWFDSFFGEERFDDAASKMRGNAFLIAESRQGRGLEWKPGLRVRVYVTGRCNLDGYAEISSLSAVR